MTISPLRLHIVMQQRGKQTTNQAWLRIWTFTKGDRSITIRWDRNHKNGARTGGERWSGRITREQRSAYHAYRKRNYKGDFNYPVRKRRALHPRLVELFVLRIGMMT